MFRFTCDLRDRWGNVYETLLIHGMEGDGEVHLSRLTRDIPDLSAALDGLESLGLIRIDGDIITIERFLELVLGTMVPKMIDGAVQFVAGGTE